ncbi:MAG: DNA mismatch repair endonuclease MutL [Saprospiraceae bacterium]|nr:DNA mismatch repair endonuclease MutL [Saprospiraceae bacterium]
MSGLIKLLPDVVINQIAAGEVIQRPSSVVKELMDNALDSGASEISLKVSQAGKEMILIQDNGCGMSPVDARMAFERHATSKISNSEDLYKIQTMGFRGEALASIAAVARVELKTKRPEDEVGTRILIQDSKLIKQEACACLNGTQIQVSDLFYSVPARKKFLKTDSVELRHIHDEFVAHALSHPEIKMSLVQNETEMYLCRPETLKQRIATLFGKKYLEPLIEIQQDTEIVKIKGFLGNVELVRKSRGEQFLYINHRLVKSNYLNHAIQSAYEEVLSIEGYPFYILFLEIDPANIDINVHPTKHEIKINDERLVYNFTKVAIKQVLGRQILAPQLDFENAQPGLEKIFNTSGFKSKTSSSGISYESSDSVGSKTHWKNLAFPSASREEINDRENLVFQTESKDLSRPEENVLFQVDEPLDIKQLYSTYIFYATKEGIYIVDQQNAHERIMYEAFLNSMVDRPVESRNLLFPQTVHLPRNKSLVLKSILQELNNMGLVIEEFGSDSFVVQAVPLLLKEEVDVEEYVQQILEQFSQFQEVKLSMHEQVARSLSKSGSLKRGKELSIYEMQSLIKQLLQCTHPDISPTGKKCIYSIRTDELHKIFK